MFSLFNQKKQSESREVYQDLKNFYNSFFSNIYNEMNIGRYRQIRDAIGLVQARVAMNHLHLTHEQQDLMKKLSDATKYVNISYVYLSPLTSVEQFVNI